MNRPERIGLRPRLDPLPLVALAWLSLLLIPGCAGSGGACLDGGSHCAAAEAQPGMRSLRRGYRIGRYHWRRRTNRESGLPDVGLQAEWLPLEQRR